MRGGGEGGGRGGGGCFILTDTLDMVLGAFLG